MTESTQNTDAPEIPVTTVQMEWVREGKPTLKFTVDVIDPHVADVLSGYTIKLLASNVVVAYRGQCQVAHSNKLNQGRKLKSVLRTLAAGLDIGT